MSVRTFAQQKAALTRALSIEDTEARREKVVAECRRTIAEWDSQEWADAHKVRRGAWPDDWARWERALNDVHQWPNQPRLEEL